MSAKYAERAIIQVNKFVFMLLRLSLLCEKIGIVVRAADEQRSGKNENDTFIRF